MRNFWNLILNNVTGVLFFLLAQVTFAQLSKPEIEFPANNSYLFPIRPGMPASLAGTMGELRNTHFHTGIDIRTNSETGWPVIASNDGYISRAGVSRTGYGLVLYVKHPDGNSTVYGHLDKFNPIIHDYIVKERYRRKESEIDLYFRSSQFPVKKGDTIAFAGNTGASAGPHLHFDIRDANNLALNPLNYNFGEIRDNAPPYAQKIAFKTLDINSRINDRFGRLEFYLQRSGRDFLLTQPILAHGTIGIELLAHDIVDNARFKCGVNYIEVWLDSIMVFNQNIQELNLNQSRAIYTVMDFKKLQTDGNRFYRLYKEDGNNLNFYSQSPGSGKIKIPEARESNVKIIMKDHHGNTSYVRFRLRHSEPVKDLILLDVAKPELTAETEDNTLVLSIKPCSEDIQNALLYSKGTTFEMEPAYQNDLKSVYLIDLRKTLPDSIQVCDQTYVTNLKARIPSSQEYKYYSDRIDIHFPDKALYDTLYLKFRHQLRTDSMESFVLGPVAAFSRGINITLKPLKSYTKDNRTAVYRKRGRSFSYEGGEWSGGKISFSPRELGEFMILTDSVPPTITRIYTNNQAVRFKISDNLSGIDRYEANINGKWLLMYYDAKSGALVSERQNPAELIRGDFELTVTDKAGNKKTYTQRIL